MFKENKEFWLYSGGIIIGLILVYFVVVSYQFPFVGFLTTEKKEFKYKAPPIMQIDVNKDYRAKIITNLGDIDIDLYEKNAPLTVNNFVFLSGEGFYNGVRVHRIIKDFLIQTGSRTTLNNDPSDDGLGDPGYHFDDEINWDSLNLTAEQKDALRKAGYVSDDQVVSRRLEKFSVAMANAGPSTNGSQFFIVTANNDDPRLQVLQGRHTVFGSVVGGFDVLEKINNTELIKLSEDDYKPVDDIYIKQVIIEII